MSTVDLPNIREPFLDARTGQISRAWWIWLQQLMTRIGGSSGEDISALAQAVRDLIALTTAQGNEINGFIPLPPDLDEKPDEGMVYMPYQDLSQTAPVLSVFGRTGSVTAQSGDYTVGQVTNAASVLATLAQFAATTSAQLAGVISDETGSGALVFGTSPTVTTPNIVGTATNNNAAAGSVGEFLSNSASGVSVPNSTNTNLVSLALTAGDWDVSGSFEILMTGTNQGAAGWTSTTSAGSQPTEGWFGVLGMASAAGTTIIASPTPKLRISTASSTTVYIVGYASFSSGTATGKGYIRARRIR